MLKINKNNLREIGYEIKDEAKLSSIFGVGNGYFGIRGSLEEFGDVFIQGCYVRGVFDQIVEIPQTFSDNIYMKKYYFDGQKLKQFEHEDSCINIADITTIRFYVDGKLFLPWEGKVVRWNRYIDYSDGTLVRKVLWDDGRGNLTKFTFKRGCSFADNHIFFQTAKAEKVNHNLPIVVTMGVDTLVKTNGQHKSQVVSANNAQDEIELKFTFGDKYHMSAALKTHNEIKNAVFKKAECKDGYYYSEYESNEKTVEVKKVVCLYASCDFKEDVDLLAKCNETNSNYRLVYRKHKKEYSKAFSRIDIKLTGNVDADVLLRYANYQTLIGFDRYDSVHSLSAKNLTAEKYNQFVWWDCEILQLPIVIATFPEAAKACLEYRYRCLEEAKKNAKHNGYDGAQFAFCSSVKGDENVWIYARHPFLQIHITADVGYGIYNYYQSTLDREFMEKQGLEMLVEIAKYFISRSTFVHDRYEILNVTGTDEHHDYVNNDAYTNYLVHYVLGKTLKLIEEFDYTVDVGFKCELQEYVEKLYLPICENGLIPQFDGYFSLKPYLPLVGNGAAKGFQMKASGLYHLSQIIKQPDVMNIYSYLDINCPGSYKDNWKFYEKKCEASSSLTYPVHALCAIDQGENKKFLKYFFESLKIDIDDIHNCAYQGVHAGCIAGGYYNIFRGVLGIREKEDCLIVNPKFNNPFKKIEMNFFYHGIEFHVVLNRRRLVLTSHSKISVQIVYKTHVYEHQDLTIIKK